METAPGSIQSIISQYFHIITNRQPEGISLDAGRSGEYGQPDRKNRAGVTVKALVSRAIITAETP
jgi:hypothetical protein